MWDLKFVIKKEINDEEENEMYETKCLQIMSLEWENKMGKMQCAQNKGRSMNR